MSAASAATVYTDRAAWEAAIAGAPLSSDNFSNPINSAQSITLDSGIVSTNSIPPILPNGFDNNSVSILTAGAYDNAAGGTTASATISWVFPASVFAFGADFFRTNANGLTLSGDFDGSGNQTLSVNNTLGGADGFLGIVGSAVFTGIVFANPSGVVDSFSIDNASFAVPEPASLALMLIAGLGMLATGIGTRR